MDRHRAAEKMQVENLIARLPDDIRVAAVEEGRGLRDRKAANGALAYIDRLLVDREELETALTAEKERAKAGTLRADALKAEIGAIRATNLHGDNLDAAHNDLLLAQGQTWHAQANVESNRRLWYETRDKSHAKPNNSEHLQVMAALDNVYAFLDETYQCAKAHSDQLTATLRVEERNNCASGNGDGWDDRKDESGPDRTHMGGGESGGGGVSGVSGEVTA